MDEVMGVDERGEGGGCLTAGNKRKEKGSRR